MSIQPHHRLPENLLLASLQVHERNAVQRASVVIACSAGQVLVTAGAAIDHAIFPIDLVVGVVRRLRDGSEIELGLVGSEGMLGGGPLADTKTTPDDVVVRSAGAAYCMPVEAFQHQFACRGGLHGAVLRFTRTYLSQLEQNAVCSRYHTPEQRLARWLLMVHERSAAAEIEVTATALSRFLGASLLEIEQALRRLAGVNALRHRRNSVLIVEAEALEMHACECFDALRQTG